MAAGAGEKQSKSSRCRVTGCAPDLRRGQRGEDLLRERNPKNFAREGYAVSGSMLLVAYRTMGCGLTRRTLILHLAHELASLQPGGGRHQPHLGVTRSSNGVIQARRKWVRFSGRHWHAVVVAEGYNASLTLFILRAHHRLSVTTAAVHAN
eukprot:2251945-Amphidinium_carterae.2